MRPKHIEPVYEDIKSIGIPNALLTHSYKELWQTFFKELGRTCVFSGTTDKGILDAGDALSIDECCLASKIYMGHVRALLGTCDAVFVPSFANFGRQRMFCTKFQALPDIVANTFREHDIRLVCCHADSIDSSATYEDAYIDLALRFGADMKLAKHALHKGLAAQIEADTSRASAQEALLRAPRTDEDELRVLVVAHPYVSGDPLLGKPVIDILEKLQVHVALASETDHDKAFKASLEFSETMPWLVNRELVGSILLLHEKVDGIVLLSSFPCGPDSMAAEAVIRCIKGRPILNMTVDGMSGTAGIETRLESFVDILRYQKKGGYSSHVE